MTILKFLGTTDISHNDNYGTIQLRLALDLVCAARLHPDKKAVKEKACNIIQVCVESLFDALTLEYDWSLEESVYAEQIVVRYVERATCELLAIVNRKITHQRRREKQTKLRIEDLKVAAVLAYMMTVSDNVHEEIVTEFINEHGEMYFSER